MRLSTILFSVTVLTLAGCAERAGPTLSNRPSVERTRLSVDQIRQEKFCAGLGEVLSAQDAAFVPVRGAVLDRKIWLSEVRLPGMRLCTISTHVKPVFECRASEGEWGAAALLQDEFRYFSKLLDGCLGDAGEAGRWYESRTTETPPGLAKFYKQGKTHVYLSTNQDARSQLFYTSLRIEG